MIETVPNPSDILETARWRCRNPGWYHRAHSAAVVAQHSRVWSVVMATRRREMGGRRSQSEVSCSRWSLSSPPVSLCHERCDGWELVLTIIGESFSQRNDLCARARRTAVWKPVVCFVLTQAEDCYWKHFLLVLKRFGALSSIDVCDGVCAIVFCCCFFNQDHAADLFSLNVYPTKLFSPFLTVDSAANSNPVTQCKNITKNATCLHLQAEEGISLDTNSLYQQHDNKYLTSWIS